MYGRGLRVRRAWLARARSLPARPLSAAMLAGVWVSNAARAWVAPASLASPAAAALHSRWPGTEVSRDSRGLVWWWLGSRVGAGLGADLLFQCVDAPRAPASPSPAGACTVRPAGPHPAGRLSQAPPHLSPLGAERRHLPPGFGSCPRLTPQLPSLQFGTTPPLPRACSPLDPGPSWPALPRGIGGRGYPSPRLSRPRDWIPLPGPHSTAQRGRGLRSQAPAAFCSAWDGRDLAALLGRVRVGEPRVGSASSGRPSLSRGLAPSEREPSALGEAGHS